jgi:hypothetical protein
VGLGIIGDTTNNSATDPFGFGTNGGTMATLYSGYPNNIDGFMIAYDSDSKNSFFGVVAGYGHEKMCKFQFTNYCTGTEIGQGSPTYTETGCTSFDGDKEEIKQNIVQHYSYDVDTPGTTYSVAVVKPKITVAGQLELFPDGVYDLLWYIRYTRAGTYTGITDNMFTFSALCNINSPPLLSWAGPATVEGQCVAAWRNMSREERRKYKQPSNLVAEIKRKRQPQRSSFWEEMEKKESKEETKQVNTPSSDFVELQQLPFARRPLRVIQDDAKSVRSETVETKTPGSRSASLKGKS